MTSPESARDSTLGSIRRLGQQAGLRVESWRFVVCEDDSGKVGCVFGSMSEEADVGAIGIRNVHMVPVGSSINDLTRSHTEFTASQREGAEGVSVPDPETEKVEPWHLRLPGDPIPQSNADYKTGFIGREYGADYCIAFNELADQPKI